MTRLNDEWFDRYRFCQPLGQGGMGVIYLAEDKNNNNSQCVIKQLIPKGSDVEEHDEAKRLFRREVELLRQLQHRGIVRFFDCHVTEDDKHFLVMDYVPGKNLETIVATFGPFNSEATVEIGIQCCEVLEYLHERKEPIIYRDLKPSNLMLTPEGEIVFIDFGIARFFLPKGQAATRVVTAGYSPPEQYFGRPETRSDIYSLGATLGHLLTGQRPKPLSSSAPRLIKHDVIPSIDDLVRRMTAHNPEDRPPTARQVRYELYKIYQEIHPDFDIPEEALIGLDKLSIANDYIGSRSSKTPSDVHRYSGDYKPPESANDYDTYDLRRLTEAKAASTKRKLGNTPKPGIIQRIRDWFIRRT